MHRMLEQAPGSSEQGAGHGLERAWFAEQSSSWVTGGDAAEVLEKQLTPESLHAWEREKPIKTTIKKNRAKLLRLPIIATDVSGASSGDD